MESIQPTRIDNKKISKNAKLAIGAGVLISIITTIVLIMVFVVNNKKNNTSKIPTKHTIDSRADITLINTTLPNRSVFPTEDVNSNETDKLTVLIKTVQERLGYNNVITNLPFDFNMDPPEPEKSVDYTGNYRLIEEGDIRKFLVYKNMVYMSFLSDTVDVSACINDFRLDNLMQANKLVIKYKKGNVIEYEVYYTSYPNGINGERRIHYKSSKFPNTWIGTERMPDIYKSKGNCYFPYYNSPYAVCPGKKSPSLDGDFVLDKDHPSFNEIVMDCLKSVGKDCELHKQFSINPMDIYHPDKWISSIGSDTYIMAPSIFTRDELIEQSNDITT